MNSKIILVLLAAVFFGFGLGYSRGWQVMQLQHQATLAQLKQEQAAQEQAHSLEHAQWEHEANQQLLAEIKRADTLANQLLQAKTNLTLTQENFKQRLKNVAQTSTKHCDGLPADWVQLYNESTQAQTTARQQASYSSPDAVYSSASTPFAARLQPDFPNPLTTPLDVLAHVQDYGLWCQTLELQLLTLKTFLQSDSAILPAHLNQSEQP